MIPIRDLIHSCAPLVRILTSDPNSLAGKVYTAHIRTIMEESMVETIIKNDVDELQSLIADAVDTDPNKFFSMNEFYSNVEEEFYDGPNDEFGFPIEYGAAGITSTVTLRNAFLAAHPAISRTPPEIFHTKLVEENGVIYAKAEVYLTDQVELMATTSPYNTKFEPFFDV